MGKRVRHRRTVGWDRVKERRGEKVRKEGKGWSMRWEGEERGRELGK